MDDEGDTRSLVVDETFASFYRPGEIVTHCVWDAIAAPILWLPPKRRRRILVLGLGGGSVARIARALAPEAEIVGVEFEPEVVRLARRHLDLDEIGLRVEVADARTWVEAESERAPRYDAILEDVFVGSGDDVHKPDWIPEPMHAQAFGMLAPGGVFVSNTLDEHARVAKSMRAHFEGLVAIETEDYDNRVLAAGGPGLSGAALRERVAASDVLAPSLEVLSFRTRRAS
ncbi:MAG: fused MFS/spermidine synthase [bacterium]|nr:fused MFS/spermidine synthase [bacterium]